MLATEKIQTALGEVYYDNGILFIEMKVKNPTMEDAEKHQQLMKENFGKYDISLSLTDTTRGVEINKAIRDYLAGDELSASIKASAVLVINGAQKILANLFLQFFKPKYEIKLFTEKDKAIEWLNKFK